MVSNIVLIGYMGSGKSSVGKYLATRLNKVFLDLDDYIEAKEGKKITDIFKDHGEVYFRKKEKQFLVECLKESDNTIISLGGGTPCFGDNMDVILRDKKSISVYLKTSISTLTDRLYDERAKRPLIAHANSVEALTEFIAKHLFERNIFYTKSEIIVATDNKEISSISEEIENAILRILNL